MTYNPAAFYRGYELGNGIHDWTANPGGRGQFLPRETIYGNKAVMQVIGSNTHNRISINAFRFGADASPKDFHDWWAWLYDRICVTDSSLFTIPERELVLIRSKTHDLITFSGVGDISEGSTSLDLTGTLASGDIIFVYDPTQTDNRSTDIVQVTNTVGTIEFQNVRTGASGLSHSYDTSDAIFYKAEAVYRNCAFSVLPEIPPADQGSRGNFRSSILFHFLTNSDRLPVV